MATDHRTLEDLRIDRSGFENPRSKRGLVWIGVAAAVVVVGLGAWWLLAHRPPEVTVATAKAVATGPAGASAVLNASGYVTARREATVSAKVTGKVVAVMVEEGMKVEKGQILARLDDSIQKRNLALADAQLAAAKSAVGVTQANLTDARITLKRTERLVAAGFASQADLDSATASAEALTAQLATAKDNVQVAQRQVALAQQNLDDTIIRAPFSGVAISKDAQPGEMISPVSAGGGFTRTGISTIVDMSSLEIEVDVNEGYIQRVEEGQKVEAVLDSYPDWRIPCHVITIVPTANRDKATVKVRIGFDALDPRILPDMGVKVSFLEGRSEGGGSPATTRVRVPKPAIREDGGVPVVLVVTDDRVERRAVKTGVESEGEVEILSGLSPGEKVVVEGPAGLADGDRVKVRGGS